MSSYRYRDDLVAVVAATHANRHGDARAEFRIEGTEGVIKGTFGLLYDYPTGRPDTLEITSRVLGTDGWLPYPVTTRWIPDAFLGTDGLPARRRRRRTAAAVVRVGTTSARSGWSRRSTPRPTPASPSP